MKAPLDVSRCLRAMQHLEISGAPRPGAIGDAIAAIQKDGDAALGRGYIGVKNYAGFGDQRADCDYGYGPKHGYLVFSIGRPGTYRHGALGADEMYLLEAARDFGTIDGVGRDGGKVLWNLCDVLRRAEQLRAELTTLDRALASATVESHAEVAP